MLAWFSPEETTAIALSVKVAVVAALASLPVGVAVAWLLARKRFPGKALLDALVHLPLVLPPVVMGYALLVMFGNQGPLGRWLHDTLGITLAFRWTGAALACAVMGFPLMVRAIRLSIENVDRKLEQAAATLGAAPWRVFLTVTLPLSLPGILAGSALVFIPAIGEFVIPDLLGGSDTLMVGKVLWNEFFSNRDWPLASAVAIVLLVVLVLPLMLLQRARGATK